MAYETTTMPESQNNPHNFGDDLEITEQQTSELRVMSGRLQMVALIFAMLIPFVVILQASIGLWGDLLQLPANITIDKSKITGFAFIVLTGVGSIYYAAVMFAFWRLSKLLGLYREGQIFTSANVIAIRNIGWSLIAIDLAITLQTALTGPVLSMFHISNAYIALKLEGPLLIVGVFMILVARVIDMGRRLKEQEKLVI